MVLEKGWWGSWDRNQGTVDWPVDAHKSMLYKTLRAIPASQSGAIFSLSLTGLPKTPNCNRQLQETAEVV
jgi:hypothetical protein